MRPKTSETESEKVKDGARDPAMTRRPTRETEGLFLNTDDAGRLAQHR